MYNEFSIESILTVLSLKKVIIKTNFSIDEGTVNHSSVQIVRISDATLEDYTIEVKEKTIELTLKNDPGQDNKKLLLRIRKVKDKLGRLLSAPVSKELSFEPEYKKILKIISPSDGTTLRSLDVDIKLEAASGETEESKYRIEVSSDTAFFNIKNSILVDELETRITVPEDGQYYMRVRAESETEDCFGIWSEPITFVVSTYSHNKDESNNDFLDDLIFNDDLFVDEKISLEKEYVTPNFTTDTPFTIELNKDLQFPEKRDGDFDVDATPPPECEIPEPKPPQKPEELPFIDDGVRHIIIPMKALQYKNKKRIKTNVYLFATNDYPNTIEIYLPGKINFEPDSIYEFNIPRLSFADNTYETIGKIKYITEHLNMLIDINDVKALIHGLKIDDEILLEHILSASDTAKYWANIHGNKIELNKETLKEDYYPFYMFIKYRAVYESILEFYMIAATNPIKFKDAISDLSREEEYDLKYLKDLLDDFEQEADRWLEMIVTITADPQWAVRGKTARAITYKFSKPYHKYPVNGYDRGGYNK